MTEEKENKKSKLSALIDQAKGEINGIQIIVHYSEDKWKTNEEINLILDEETTIGKLIDLAKEKLIDKYNIKDKKFFVRIFKKKKKIPNEEYPVCNFDSKVKDYGKSHFCLVDEENSELIEEEEKIEDKKEGKKEEKKEEIKKENEIQKVEEKKDKQKDNNNVQVKESNKGNIEGGKGKKNKGNKKCIIF